MSMVVSICHTSVLTWTIAATLKLLSTRVEEQRDPENRPDSLERKIIVFRNRSSQPSPRPECSTKVRVRKRPSTKASRKLLQFYDEIPSYSFFSPFDIEQELGLSLETARVFSFSSNSSKLCPSTRTFRISFESCYVKKFICRNISNSVYLIFPGKAFLRKREERGCL